MFSHSFLELPWRAVSAYGLASKSRVLISKQWKFKKAVEKHDQDLIIIIIMFRSHICGLMIFHSFTLDVREEELSRKPIQRGYFKDHSTIYIICVYCQLLYREGKCSSSQ